MSLCVNDFSAFQLPFLIWFFFWVIITKAIESKGFDLKCMAELSPYCRKKRAKIGFDINKNGKTLGEMEDNCVTRQEVLVQNLNEFKGQFKVELFSESRFFCCLLLVFLSLIMLQLSFLFYFAFLSVFWRLVFSDWTICCELSSKSFNPKAIAVPLNFEQWARKQPIIKEDIKIESIILCKKYCAKKTR